MDDLLFQIESLITDSDDDKHGLMKMRKLVDILDAARAATACKKVQLLKRKGKHPEAEWSKKVDKHVAEMHYQRQQLKDLIAHSK